MSDISPMRLLIADDDPVTCTKLRLQLNKWGYEVVVCTEGTEALAELRRSDGPRLAVLDWMMPGMNGVDVCRAVREIPDIPYRYIILLTVKQRRRDIVEGFDAGADDYVVKPFDPYELEVRIRGGLRIVELQEQLVRAKHSLESTNAELRHEVLERRRAERELRLAHDQLEMRVGERTAELLEANKRLEDEIVRRATAEEHIKASLQEKEVLLQEIHHRVKNNLQVISSLLGLQASRIDEPGPLSVLRESRDRVKSMALIHEQLYRSKNLSRISLGDYLRYLVGSLQRSYSEKAAAVAISVEAEDILVGIDCALPCGLIVNELVSNCLKHAFPDAMSGDIRVTLVGVDDDEYMITVSDNGCGLPADVDVRKARSLGLTLVTNLAEVQLKGRVELHSGERTEFRVLFRDKNKNGKSRPEQASAS